MAVDDSSDEEKQESAMLKLLIDYIKSEDQNKFAFVAGDESTCFKKGHWLVQSLLLNSSQAARQHSLSIFKRLLTDEKELR